MKYEWYELIKKSRKITQGDIIWKCSIPLPKTDIYQAILNNDTESNHDLYIKEADIIVLTQACDIENEKVDSIVVCPI